MTTEFKVGDIVEWNGVHGGIRRIQDDTLEVCFTTHDGKDRIPCKELFYTDGTYLKGQTTPVLKLLRRRLVKKKVAVWISTKLSHISLPPMFNYYDAHTSVFEVGSQKDMDFSAVKKPGYKRYELEIEVEE